jgi:hypothetical protein
VNEKRNVIGEGSSDDRFEPVDTTGIMDTDSIVEGFGDGFTDGSRAPALNDMDNDRASSSTDRARVLLSSDCRKETFPGAGISPYIHH